MIDASHLPRIDTHVLNLSAGGLSVETVDQEEDVGERLIVDPRYEGLFQLAGLHCERITQEKIGGVLRIQLRFVDMPETRRSACSMPSIRPPNVSTFRRKLDRLLVVTAARTAPLNGHTPQIEYPFDKPPNAEEQDNSRNAPNNLLFKGLVVQPEDTGKEQRNDGYLPQLNPNVKRQQRDDCAFRRQPKFAQHIGEAKAVHQPEDKRGVIPAVLRLL